MKKIYALFMLSILIFIVGCGKEVTDDTMEQTTPTEPPMEQPVTETPVIENTATAETGASIAEVDDITNELEDTETEAELDNLDDFVNQI